MISLITYLNTLTCVMNVISFLAFVESDMKSGDARVSTFRANLLDLQHRLSSHNATTPGSYHQFRRAGYLRIALYTNTKNLRGVRIRQNPHLDGFFVRFRNGVYMFGYSCIGTVITLYEQIRLKSARTENPSPRWFLRPIR
jgi:hypothetical protein